MTFTERFAWILKERGITPNALCERAGVSRSYLRNLEKSEALGRHVRPGADVLDKFARAANVSTLWLGTGKGERVPYEGPVLVEAESPTPPPVSDTVTSLDTVDELINSAFDPDRHKPSDAGPVRDALRAGAPLLKASVDPVAHVRYMLDATARRRERGQRTTTDELPSATVGLLSDELRASQAAEARLQEVIEQARKWMRDNGIDPDNLPSVATAQGPAPSKPRHPKTLKSQ